MPLTRRELLSALAATAASAALTEMSSGAPPLSPSVGERVGDETLRINASRLQQSLEGLSVFGRPDGGTFADGVSRVAYSDADVAGRKYAMQLMHDAGLDPRVDAGGNITATRLGSDSSLKPI